MVLFKPTANKDDIDVRFMGNRRLARMLEEGFLGLPIEEHMKLRENVGDEVAEQVFKNLKQGLAKGVSIQLTTCKAGAYSKAYKMGPIYLTSRNQNTAFSGGSILSQRSAIEAHAASMFLKRLTAFVGAAIILPVTASNVRQSFCSASASSNSSIIRLHAKSSDDCHRPTSSGRGFPWRIE